jgi:hypothetical protein
MLGADLCQAVGFPRLPVLSCSGRRIIRTCAQALLRTRVAPERSRERELRKIVHSCS